MGGLFGAVSENNLARDLFFGVDYHSHLGTEVGGLAFLDDDIKMVYHDISNSQFKSEFQKDYGKVRGKIGIGVISDLAEEQPVKFESRIGTFALCTTGLIRNAEELYSELIETGATFKKSRVRDAKAVVNQTEIVGELISRGKDIVDGIESTHEKIEGYNSLLLLSKEDRCIYASGDTFPLVVGRKAMNWAVASETSAFPNLGYEISKFLQYREIVSIGEAGLKTRINAPAKKRFCPFLHVYYGFPASDYYGVNAEVVRERCGGFLAEKDDVKADLVLGIADSGFPHSIGYVKRKMELAKEKVEAALEGLRHGEIGLNDFERTVTEIFNSVPPLRRPLVKYTPGWGRSYIPPTQEKRELIAKYKQVPNPQIISGKRIILVDDSIRRGTQLQDLLTEKVWPYQPKEIHGRIASPPQIFPCIFDLSTRNEDLATHKAIMKIEGKDLEDVREYMDPKNPKRMMMVEEIRKMIGFTTLKYQTLEDMIKAVVEAPNNIGLKREDLCLYCWIGRF
ncbi:MAG: amidophosphoribosyltransferase [Candidatus Bathyarchaeia archaeon]